MTIRRRLFPLLLILSMLVAACGGPGTTDPGGADSSPATDGSPATEGSPTTDGSPATEGSPAADGSPATDGASGAAVNMQIAWWGSQNRHDRTIQVLDMFKEEHPNFNYTPAFAAFGDYWTRLTTQAAGGNLPCLIQHDYQYIADWVNRGLLMPLDQFVEDGTINTENIDQAYIDGGRVGPENQLYAISLGTNTQSLILDVAKFEEAGVPLPEPDWTWAEFEQIITQLHEALGTYGMSTALPDNQVYKLWVKQHGATLYNEEGTALGYEDDQIYVDFFTMLQGWMEQGLIPTREFEVSQGDVGIEDNIFVRGEAPMMYAHSNQIVAVQSAAGEDRELEVLPFPKQEGENPEPGNYLKPSQFWSITAGCPEDQAQVAAEIINFFTNDLEANEVLAAERGVPISSAVQEHIRPLVEPAQQKAFDLIAYVEENHSELDAPDPPNSPEVVDEVYVPLMDQVLYGQMTPEDAAPQFREQANAILGQP